MMPAFPLDANQYALTRRTLFRCAATAAASLVGTSFLSAGAARAARGCDYVQDNWAPTVSAYLAGRRHRLHHFVWHLTRNSWANLSEDQQDRISKVDPRWVPPRPALRKAGWDTRPRRENLRWATANGAGEDFLYFHREMIAMTDRLLREAGKGPLVSWSDEDRITPPGGGCPDEEVPPTWRIPGADALTRRLGQAKSDSFFWDRMAWWEQTYTDYAHLKTLTLGELGARIELGVHNNMHLRWSTMPWNPDQQKPQPNLRPEADIDRKWDDTRYDTLIDEYSAHVSPLFWRLHKWVDNRVRDWAEAHGDTVKAYTTDRGIGWYRPGPWVGVPEDELWVGSFHHDVAGGAVAKDDKLIKGMEKVVGIITEPGPTAPGALGAAPSGGAAITLRDLVVGF